MSNIENRRAEHPPEVVEQMLDIAGARLHKVARQRNWYGDQLDDARQDLMLWILEAAPKYNPERSAVSTWTYHTFNYWLWQHWAKVKERHEAEFLCDPRADAIKDGDDFH
ncbi:MAG: sigma factor, partial [Nocardioides sp.]